MRRLTKRLSLNLPPLKRSLVLGSIAINCLGLGLPLTMLQIFDRILPNQSFETLSVLVASLFVVVALDFTLKTLRGYSLNFDALMTELRTSEKAVRRLLSASPQELKKLPATIHLERLNAIESWRDFLSGQIRHAAIDMPFAVIFGLTIFAIGGSVVLAPLALMAIFMGGSLLTAKYTRSIAAMKKDHAQRRQDFVVESLHGLTTMKAMAMEPQMMQRFEALQESGSLLSYRNIFVGQVSQLLSATLGSSMPLFVVSTGAILAIEGSLNFGALAACSLLSGRMIQPFMSMLSVWNQWQTIEATRQQAQEVLSLNENSSVAKHTRREIDGAISLRSLTIYETGSDQRVLDNFSLDILPGSFVGFSGFDTDTISSLARVISGNKVIDRGEVSIDGVLVGSEEWNNIRENVAYVPHKIQLFRGTLLENIVMFRSGSAIDRASEVSQLIGFDKLVHSLPGGYETNLGIGTAAELAPGMLAMLGIARALTRQPKVLVLDDVTCFMDQRAITNFLEALKSLRPELTVVMATHNQAVLSSMDHQIDFSQGRVFNRPIDGRVYPVMNSDFNRSRHIFDDNLSSFESLRKVG